MTNAVKLLRFLGCLWVLNGTPLVGAAQDTKSPPPPADASPPPPSVSEWKSPEVPKSGSLQQLREFIKTTKRLVPSNHQEYLEMQRAIREAALKILQGSKQKDTDEFKEAEFEYVSSSVMLLGNENEDAPRKTFERFREYLKSKSKLMVTDLQMCLLAGQNMEQLPDRELVREAYGSFADIVESKNDEAFSGFVEIFRACVKRLDLPGTELRWTGKSLKGEDFSLDSLRGNVVVIYLFASSSQPSVTECERLSLLQKKYEGEKVSFVGISMDSDKKVLLKFLQSVPMKWTILWDETTPGTNSFATEYGFMVLPSTVLVDQAGIVQGIEAGTRTVEEAIDKLLKPVQPEPQGSPQDP